MIIYKIQNKINDKIYIGQTTTSIKKRMGSHICQRKKISCRAIENAILKYGVDNFKIQIIDNSANTITGLNELEQKYIKQYNSLAPNGYNLTTGGKNCTSSEETKRILSERGKGRIISIETRKKIGDAQRGEKNHRWGKHNSKEQNKKISLASKGKKLSEEHKLKLLNAVKGKPKSKETRKRMSESHRGKHIGENNNKAKLTEVQVKEIRQILLNEKSRREIAKEFNISYETTGDIARRNTWKHI